MTSEPARLALNNRLEEVLGRPNADTLMASLPLQPGVELATKSDIERLDSRIYELAAEMRAEFREDHKALRTQMVAIIGALNTLTGISAVIVGLID